MSDLIDVWKQSIQQIVDLCEPLNDEQWQASTPCPGWTVADVVAHIVDLEAMLAADPRPDTEPDWSTLPHVTSDLSRVIEVGVDFRRNHSKQSVLDELREVIVRREQSLRDSTGPVRGVFGNMVEPEQLLGMRIFDCWVHEQDIRIALGQPGGMNSPAAHIAARMMMRGLPKAWGKTVSPPPGSVLRITITGPDIEEDVSLIIDPDGRAIRVDQSEADVHLTMTWPDYMLAATGRTDIDSAQWQQRISADGDPDLVGRTLRALNVAP